MRANPLAGLPRAVTVAGQQWPIRWQVRDCLPVILAYEDGRLAAPEREEVLLRRLYPRIPPDRAAAAQAAVAFLDGGEEERGARAAGEDGPEEAEEPVLYSFTRDGGLIYAAFRARYGIDLMRDALHWWAFLALFGDLDPECQFCRLLRLRRGWLEGTLTRDEARAFERLGEGAKPPPQPGDRAAEANARAFLAALEGGGTHGVR